MSSAALLFGAPDSGANSDFSVLLTLLFCLATLNHRHRYTRATLKWQYGKYCPRAGSVLGCFELLSEMLDVFTHRIDIAGLGQSHEGRLPAGGKLGHVVDTLLVERFDML
jgi:hypothetical protein